MAPMVMVVSGRGELKGENSLNAILLRASTKSRREKWYLQMLNKVPGTVPPSLSVMVNEELGLSMQGARAHEVLGSIYSCKLAVI